MTSQLGRIKYGRQHDYYQELSISSPDFGGDNPDGYAVDGYYGANLMIPFSTQTVVFTNDTSPAGSKIVEFSFNGSTVHGVLDCNTNSLTKRLEFQNRVVGKIWFRVRSGSTGPISITVSAWGTR